MLVIFAIKYVVAKLNSKQKKLQDIWNIQPGGRLHRHYLAEILIYLTAI